MPASLTPRELRAISKALRYYTKNCLDPDDVDGELIHKLYDRFYSAQFWGEDDIKE